MSSSINIRQWWCSDVRLGYYSWDKTTPGQQKAEQHPQKGQISHSQTVDEPQPANERYKNHIRIRRIWYARKVESQFWLMGHEIRDFYELRRGSYNVYTLMSSAMVSITQTGDLNRAHLPLQTKSSVRSPLYLLYQLLTDTESMSNFLTVSQPSDVGQISALHHFPLMWKMMILMFVSFNVLWRATLWFGNPLWLENCCPPIIYISPRRSSNHQKGFTTRRRIILTDKNPQMSAVKENKQAPTLYLIRLRTLNIDIRMVSHSNLAGFWLQDEGEKQSEKQWIW